MSNIPFARHILCRALMYGSSNAEILRIGIEEALEHMTREQPDFIAPVKHSPLTKTQRDLARNMRATGMQLNDIAVQLGTNIGRISEAINEPVSTGDNA